VGASIVAHRDAAPILETTKRVLDAVALPIQSFVVGQHDLARPGRWDAWRDAALIQRRSKPVTVVATVAQQFACLRQSGQEQGGSPVVAHLAFGEQQHDGAALTVADGVKLGVQSAFRASDATRSTPF
jgi:hypothetical protein